jgi:hypothetical protein
MIVAAFFSTFPMRSHEPDFSRPAWVPLLVLGLSVLASVTLIGTGMALLPAEAPAAARGASAQAGPGHKGPGDTQFPASASRNTRVRSASAG